ncbi:MAG: recombinase family protein [Clostridia bacterium]|nr:recombinase family protein [Clostridia bacterium]
MTKLGLYESRTFGRISYGFVRDEKGMVYIKEDEAEIIRWMYKMCIQGLSLLQIQAELIRMGINSPTGKEEWSVVTISKTIDNKNNRYIVSDEEFCLATSEKMYRARNDRRKW